MVLHHSGFPIRRSPDQCLFTAPRGLSQLVTSFFGSWCQGIHLMLFFAWTSLIDLSINHALSFIANNFFYGCVFTIFRLISKICSFLLHHIRKDLLIFIIHFIPRNKTWSFLIICSFLFLFIRFSMNCEKLMQASLYFRLTSYQLRECYAFAFHSSSNAIFATAGLPAW